MAMLWLLMCNLLFVVWCQVRHEVFGQEEDQDEAGGDSRTQWENHAVVSQHRGELHTQPASLTACSEV